MAVSVLVVDDSGFFRKRVCEILGSVPEIKIVGAASNGREAIDLVKKHRPDVVTMDYEMPVMDGVTAVRNIMHECPTSILMFSSLTYEGARVTLDALEAGAVDFLPKNFEDIARDAGKMQEVLKKRILTIASKGRSDNLAPVQKDISSPDVTEEKQTLTNGPYKNESPPAVKRSSVKVQSLQRNNTVTNAKTSNRSDVKANAKVNHPVSLLVIGASTGGPVALQKVLSKIPENFPCPILIVQHMPATFTPAFAERLNKLCKIKVEHGEDGVRLKKGVAVLAPGAKQMILSGQGRQISILDGDERLTYKPSVDVTFGSAAKAYPGKVLSVVLTGMGADGREGCRMLKQTGSTVFTQNESSCVIYGMPMAVDNAGYSDASLDVDEIASAIVAGVM